MTKPKRPRIRKIVASSNPIKVYSNPFYFENINMKWEAQEYIKNNPFEWERKLFFGDTQ